MRKIVLATFALVFAVACDHTEKVEQKIIREEKAIEIQKHVDNIENKEELLVVFDCDDVLVIKEDPIGQAENMKDLVEILTKIEKHTSKKDFSSLLCTILVKNKQMLIEQEMSSVVKHIQDSGVKTIVLTQIAPGKYDDIASVEEFRIQMLHSFGYHFERSWPNSDVMEFKNLEKTRATATTMNFMETSKNYPVFYMGVLFCGFSSKNEVLGEFINRIDFKPRTIVFIDDRQSYLDVVKQYCQENNIEFLGIHYTGNLKKNVKCSKASMEKQIKTFLKTKKWVPLKN
ncbi:MAG: DUF2608 domain-containing protein [Holosporales bacterium]|jgi:predicted house-cleaning NTP pyrophosphatase (Maf/HAM1 superfamily)|nr:DUF2608 domain-containing protein [Holosporales bacterium]